MTEIIALTSDLIRLPSVTPDDAGCQALLIERLLNLNFDVVSLPQHDTQNLWARKGTEAPLIVFAGHTDVVAPGPVDLWKTPPFQPTIIGDNLYGRGAADMKGSIAAMMIATENFLKDYPNFKGSIGLLITSAEEGPSQDGTPIVLDYLQENGITIDYCIVGEPTSLNTFGDTLKNGRRGSLTGKLTVFGKQGHIAYPHLANNPIHQIFEPLNALTMRKWDTGNAHFDPTAFQISNIHAGVGAGNVIPGEIVIDFNLRYSPEVTADYLKREIETVLKNHQLRYQIDWTHFGEPFHTTNVVFLTLCQQIITEVCGIRPALSTSGGTSDARYIAKICEHVIEFGPLNATIHQVNEHTAIPDLEKLTQVYFTLLKEIMLK